MDCPLAMLRGMLQETELSDVAVRHLHDWSSAAEATEDLHRILAIQGKPPSMLDRHRLTMLLVTAEMWDQASEHVKKTGRKKGSGVFSYCIIDNNPTEQIYTSLKAKTSLKKRLPTPFCRPIRPMEKEMGSRRFRERACCVLCPDAT